MLLRSVVTIALVAMSTACFGEDAAAGGRSHNVYLNLFESSNYINVSYDTRFGNSEVMGWRVGLGYSTCYVGDYYFKHRPGISLPLGVNALFGHRASKFELGLGVCPGLYAFRQSKYVYDQGPDYDYSYYEDYGKTKWRGACTFSLDLGYRLQRRSGFGLRVGFSPSVSVWNSVWRLQIMSFIPYIGLGYTFR